MVSLAQLVEHVGNGSLANNLDFFKDQSKKIVIVKQQKRASVHRSMDNDCLK